VILMRFRQKIGMAAQPRFISVKDLHGYAGPAFDHALDSALGIGFGGFENARVDGPVSGPEYDVSAIGLALKPAVEQHAPVGADELAIQGASAAWKPRPFIRWGRSYMLSLAQRSRYTCVPMIVASKMFCPLTNPCALQVSRPCRIDVFFARI